MVLRALAIALKRRNPSQRRHACLSNMPRAMRVLLLVAVLLLAVACTTSHGASVRAGRRGQIKQRSRAFLPDAEKDKVTFNSGSDAEKAEAVDPSAVSTKDVDDEKTKDQDPEVTKSKKSKRVFGKGKLSIVDNDNSLIDGVRDKWAIELRMQEQFYKKQRVKEEKEKMKNIKAEEKVKFYHDQVLDRQIQANKVIQEQAHKTVEANKRKVEAEAEKRFRENASKKVQEEEKKRPLKAIRFFHAQDFCLNLYQNKRVEGGRVNIWECSTGSSQNWRFWNDGTIRVADDKKWCLQSAEYVASNGVLINIGVCKAGAQQQRWVVRSDHTIRYAANPSFGLDLDNGIVHNGQKIHMWSTAPNFNQKWVLADPSSNGIVYKTLTLHLKHHRDRCLNLHRNLGQTGAQINVWACNKHISQTWRIWNDKSVRVGWKPGFCLGVKGNNPGENAVVELQYCGFAPNKYQKWHRFGNAFYFDADRKYVLDVQDGKYRDQGALAVLRQRSGSDIHLWQPHEVE